MIERRPAEAAFDEDDTERRAFGIGNEDRVHVPSNVYGAGPPPKVIFNTARA